MRVKLAKWGNSLGIRVPKAAADAAGIGPGTELDLAVERGGFRLRIPGKSSRELLEEMIAEARRLEPGSEPATIDWGPDRDSESITDDDPR